MNETVTTGMIVGLYIALCACMSRQRVGHANDCLLAFSEDPRTPDHEAHLFRLLVETVQDVQDRREPDFSWVDVATHAGVGTPH